MNKTTEKAYQFGFADEIEKMARETTPHWEKVHQLEQKSDRAWREGQKTLTKKYPMVRRTMQIAAPIGAALGLAAGTLVRRRPAIAGLTSLLAGGVGALSGWAIPHNVAMKRNPAYKRDFNRFWSQAEKIEDAADEARTHAEEIEGVKVGKK